MQFAHPVCHPVRPIGALSQTALCLKSAEQNKMTAVDWIDMAAANHWQFIIEKGVIT